LLLFVIQHLSSMEALTSFAVLVFDLGAMVCCVLCKVLRIRSELRKRKLTSVCVERVLNVQGTAAATTVDNDSV